MAISLFLGSRPASAALAFTALLFVSACSCPECDQPETLADFPIAANYRYSPAPACKNAEQFIRALWEKDASYFFDNCLCEARRCEGTADMLRYELYENAIIPAGPIKSIQPMSFSKYQQLSEAVALTIDSGDARIANAERFRSSVYSSWQVNAANFPLWICLAITEEDGAPKIMFIEIKTEHLGRPLPEEPPEAKQQCDRLLSLCQNKDFEAIATIIQTDMNCHYLAQDELMQQIAELAETLAKYDRQTLRYLGGEYWYEGTQRLNTYHWQLSNDKTDLRFKLSYNSKGQLVYLDFEQ